MSENSVQNACGQRDSEPGIECIEAADREHRPDGDVSDVVPAAEDRRRTREQKCSGDGPTKRLHQQDGGDEDADQHADGAPVTRHVGVDVLPVRTARYRDHQDNGKQDEDDADDDREHLGPNGIHLRETRFEGHRVIDQEGADHHEHDADKVLRLVDGLCNGVFLWLFGGRHSSPSSVSVDETRSSWSFRNCSNSAPVTNASVQPFFTSASFHWSVACKSLSTFTIAFLDSSEIPGGARTPRQLAKVRSIPDSFSVGASMPSTRLSLDTASTRS